MTHMAVQPGTAATNRVACDFVRAALTRGERVYARLNGDNHPGYSDGDVVEVRFAGPRDLYQPLNPDGSSVYPDAPPAGYVVGPWQVAWSGGGFFNPHTILQDRMT